MPCTHSISNLWSTDSTRLPTRPPSHRHHRVAAHQPLDHLPAERLGAAETLIVYAGGQDRRRRSCGQCGVLHRKPFTAALGAVQLGGQQRADVVLKIAQIRRQFQLEWSLRPARDRSPRRNLDCLTFDVKRSLNRRDLQYEIFPSDLRGEERRKAQQQVKPHEMQWTLRLAAQLRFLCRAWSRPP